MIFTLTDRDWNPLDVYETKDYLIGVYTGYVTKSLEMSVETDVNNAGLWKEGNYILCKDNQGYQYWFTIYKAEDSNTDIKRTITAYSGSLDIMNEDANPIPYPSKAQPFAYYFNRVFGGDSGITIGINEIGTLTRSLEYTSENASMVEMIQYVLNGFDAEADISIELEGSVAKNLKMNVFKRIGKTEPQDIITDVNDSLVSLDRTGSVEDLATALKPYATTSDNKELTLVGKYYEEKDSDGKILYYSDTNSPHIKSVVGHQNFFVNLENKATGDNGYIVRRYSSQAKTQDALWAAGLAQLKQIDHVSFKYEVKGTTAAKIGDNVQIVSTTMKEPVYLEARLMELKFNDDVPDINEYTFGNYKTLESNLDSNRKWLEEIKSQIISIVLPVEVMYAASTQGDTPPTTGWIQTIPRVAEGMYLWTRTVTNFSNGDRSSSYTVSLQGKNGIDGSDGLSSYLHVAYANSKDGLIDFSLTEANGKEYVGTYSDHDKTNSLDPTKYTWMKTKGEEGATAYLHIAYANDEEGKTGFSTTVSKDKLFIGQYNDHTAADSEDPTKYKWSRIKGADGAPGKDGTDAEEVYGGYLTNPAIVIASTAGGVVTDYTTAKGEFVVTVGNNVVPSGVTYEVSQAGGMTVTINNKGAYQVTGVTLDNASAILSATLNGITIKAILVVSKTKQGLTGSTGPKGDPGKDGVAGKDGVGVISTEITYAQNSSGNSAPTTGWTTNVPTLVKGQYLWSRTVWSYTDGTNEIGYSVSYNAKDGNTGKDGVPGKDGVGITNTIISYASSTSGTTTPTSGWTGTIPNVPAGNFLWTRYVWNYSDTTSETGYSVAKMGNTGATGPTGPKGDTGQTGKDGIAGKDGVGVASTTVLYSQSTSATIPPTSGWQLGVPTLIKGQYLWTKTTWAYTDASSEEGYSISYNAKDGNDGEDGIAGKDGVGIKSTAISYVGSTSGTTTPTTGWSTAIPTVAAGSYLWTKTVWTYTDNTTETGYSVAKMGSTGPTGAKGATGATGAQGPKGDKGDTGKDGVAGKDGVGVSGTTIKYAQSTSGTTAPTSGWTTTVPTLVKGQYLWTQTVWTYTDNTTEAGYSVSYNAKDGNDGNNGVAGKDGVGITKTSITYAGSTSGTTAPTSGWTTTIPTVAAGSYLWTKTVWTYTDNSTETGYSVAKMGNTGPTGSKGETGSTGKDGVAGKDGVGIASTTFLYAGSTSSTVAPTSGWQGSVPSLAKGQYLWTKTTWLYTDGTNEIGYSVSYIAKDGNDGEDGVAGKDGVGISKTAIAYSQSTSGVVAPSSGWTANVPTLIKGQYLWTRTVWTYTDNTTETGYSVAYNGKDGSKGETGKTGATGAPTGIVKSDTIPPNPYSGMLWQCTVSTITGYDKDAIYRWNGSKWELFLFTAVNIVADSLSSISANLGEVTAGTITGTVLTGSSMVNPFDTTINSGKDHITGRTIITNGVYASNYTFVNTNETGLLKIGSNFMEMGRNDPDGTSTSYSVIENSGYMNRNKGYDSSSSLWKERKINIGRGNGGMTIDYFTSPDKASLGNTVGSTSKLVSHMGLSTASIAFMDQFTGYSGSITAKQAYWLENTGTKLLNLLPGGAFASGNQRWKPSMPLSNCLNGWILEWQGFVNGKPSGGDFTYTPVPKVHGEEHGGAVMSLIIVGHGGGIFRKILYISNTTITGHNNNDKAPANTAVLTAVYSY